MVHLDLGSGCARRYGDLAQGYRTRWQHQNRVGAFYDPARNPTNLELLQQAQEITREVGRQNRHENVHEDGPLAGRPPASRGLSRGAACQNRTDDLLITSEMLYQLS